MTKTSNAITIIDAFLLEGTAEVDDVCASLKELATTSFRQQMARIGLPCDDRANAKLLRQTLAKFRVQVRNTPSYCNEDELAQKMLYMGSLYSLMTDYIGSKITDKEFDRQGHALMSAHKKLDLSLLLNDFIWKLEFLTAPSDDSNATGRLAMVACCLETQRRLRQHWNTVFSDQL
ncbi:MAG TPA: hypothetical protein VGK19_22410 [Capsulimonadaceae bacterium]|jgi:hypothetical protein